MNNLEPPSNIEGIAIIGMSGRFPKAKNIEEFWQNICQGNESISTFTNEELAAEKIDANLLKDTNYIKAKGFVEDIDLFDAAFFGFNPKEAEITDPQHRLFLECSWETLETAGYDPNSYAGRIGVYGGTGWNSYLLLNIASHQNFLDAVVGHQTLISNEKDHLTTRVSYKLNLKGPSIDVQTACSTSLVAVSLACQSLLNYQCDMALAGGVTLTMPNKSGYLYQNGGVLSPDGHCRAFDANAQGTVFGNGVGVVLLKRLEDAIADGDTIHAVIKGSAINNDGAVKIGYTAPSVDGQAEVIAEAIGLADINPETIGYIETHGTGTILGDPIEIKALTKAFSHYTKQHEFCAFAKRAQCAIGSVKSNIGHLDAAAGIAGLIKATLAVKYGLIPPSLHFEKPNPQIDFANSPFYVNTELTEWKQNGNPRRAGVSSLGIGGTNSHVILEEAPALPASSESRPYQLLVLSAKTPSALEKATDNLAEYLQQHPDLNLADVAYTLQIGRREFEHRRILVFHNLEDAVKGLKMRDPQRVFSQSPNVKESSAPKIVFMFPGQGSQYVGMGRELYETESVFREEVDRCCELLQPVLGLDLRSLIYPNNSENQTLQDTAFAQPALFIIEYALAKLWMSWGITPQALIGHSIGEYVAACLAGVFSLEDALKLVAMRGKLMQTMPGGAMLAVSLSAADVREFLNEELSLAASNSAALCVVSGTYEAIDNLEAKLTSQEINCRRLHTSHAFHSAMMSPILEPFIEVVKQVKLNPPQLSFISNVTGTWITEKEATDPQYWAKHLRQTVKFAEGLSQLQEKPNCIFLEVGLGHTLSRFTKQHSPQFSVLSSLRHPKDKQSDIAFLFNTLGKLWLAGVAIDWSKIYAGERRYRLPLPTYPFERQRYWIEPQIQEKSVSSFIGRLQKKPQVSDWFYLPIWKRTLPLEISSRDREKQNWLMFIDASNLGAEIAERLILEGDDVITVAVGEKFAQINDSTYTINPQNRDDYESLITNLEAQGKIPDRIVHLWSLTDNETSENNFEKCQHFGLYSLLFLTQAIGKSAQQNPLEISVITNNVYDVTGEESICPEKATILAASQVIPQEYANIKCRHIDVLVPSNGTFAKQQIESIFAELILSPLESAIAYRGKHRWMQTFEPISTDLSVNNGNVRLREKGVYLITGAFNDVGLILAEYLAQTVRAKLILLEHLDVPERDEWGQKKLQIIKEFSSEVLLIRADVANEAEMKNAIAQAYEKFGEINGVIYAAETNADTSFSSIQKTSLSECEWHFKPKAYGLLILEKLLRDKSIDFCILQSSIASLIGGFVAHSAANIFMDAFARKHDKVNSVSWISVNWEGWQFWEERQLTSRGKTAELALLPQEGIAAFQHLLSIPQVSQIVISTADLSARIKQQNQHQIVPPSTDSVGANSSNRSHLLTSYVPPSNEIEATIIGIWEELIGIEPIGIHDNFFELGGHSLLAVQTVSRIRELFQVELPLRNLLFDTPTVAQLAEAIAEKQANSELDEMAQLLKEIENLSPEQIQIELDRESKQGVR